MLRLIAELSLATLMIIALLDCWKENRILNAEPDEPTGQMCVDAYKGIQYVGVYAHPIRPYQQTDIRGLDLSEPYPCVEDIVNIY